MKSFSLSPLLLILILNSFQDPSCAWDIRNNQCAPHSGSPADASALLQNLAEGFHAGCGGATAHPGKTFLVEKTSACLSTTLPLLLCHPFCFQFPSPLSTFSIPGLSSGLSDDLNMEVNHQQEYYGLSMRTVLSREYSEKTLSLACASSALLSLLAGFLAGYCFFKRCSPARSDKMNCGHAYLEAQVGKLEIFYLLTHQRQTIQQNVQSQPFSDARAPGNESNG